MKRKVQNLLKYDAEFLGEKTIPKAQYSHNTSQGYFTGKSRANPRIITCFITVLLPSDCLQIAGSITFWLIK